jgi:subtilisin family serine protease
MGEIAAIQRNADWGLDRIDQTSLPLDGTYKYTSTGKGIRVFVLDSGMRLSHTEFQGRATCGFDVMQETSIPCEDLMDHGTAVAAIVGGTTVGVAKEVSLVSVKVAANGTRPLSDNVLAGVDFVLRQKEKRPKIPMVVVMSINFLKNTLFDEYVEDLILANISLITAAGNVARDACGFSPSSAKGVISVGATCKNDSVADFSNWGSCVDIYAPGYQVVSASRGSDVKIDAYEGSSFSAPYVAGVVARILSRPGQRTMTPAQIAEELRRNSVNKMLQFADAPRSSARRCSFTGVLASFLCLKN